MKTATNSNSVRMLAMLTLGIALGLVAGARLFGPTGSETIQPTSEPGTSIYKERGAAGPRAASMRGSSPRRVRRAEAVSGTPTAGSQPTLEVPAESLARVPVSAFGPRRGSPWLQIENRFELTRDVRDLLGIDDGTAGAVREVFEKAREESMRPGWLDPARVEATENGVAITIAPSSSEARERISRELDALLGTPSADVLMRFSGETLDWEFGGFGRWERILEVTRLPDETLSIRESLRPPADGSENATPVVERRVNQYRIATLPPELARFVELGDAP